MKSKNFFKINLIYFIAMSLVAIVFVLGSLGFVQSDVLSSFLIQIVVMFAVPMLMYSLLVSKSGKQTLNDFGVKKIGGRMTLISIGLGVVLYLLNSFVADVFASIISLLGYENLTSTSTVEFNYGLLLKEFALSAVLPGICEEFLHRGLMLHAGKKHGNTRFCLFASSLLFGLMHLNVNQFFYASILGFLMGYVSLMADSIVPCMIIHFMNNALSTYFFYGYQLHWNFAMLFAEIEALIYSNFLTFVLVTTISVLLLITLYRYLCRLMYKEKIKGDIIKIIKYLELNDLPIEEAQEKINEVNVLLEKAGHFSAEESKKKFSLLDKSFLISSIVLGGLITISSFIWGLI